MISIAATVNVTVIEESTELCWTVSSHDPRHHGVPSVMMSTIIAIATSTVVDTNAGSASITECRQSISIVEGTVVVHSLHTTVLAYFLCWFACLLYLVIVLFVDVWKSCVREEAPEIVIVVQTDSSHCFPFTGISSEKKTPNVNG